MHDEWKWMDNSCSTYRRWEIRDKDEKCTMLSTIAMLPSMQTQACDNVQQPLFSKGSVRIIVIQKKLNWEQAFDYCKAEHTRLLQIEDAEDQKAIEQWLKYSNPNVNEKIWIGLRQSRVFGFWIWSDKTVSYSHWRNNTMPKMPLSNHCGVINRNSYSPTLVSIQPSLHYNIPPPGESQMKDAHVIHSLPC
ncbi:hypothetical protein Q8A73_022041 [Channa argus]|nr:hypothetical protein Q8A73_022041 [Channa argus]